MTITNIRPGTRWQVASRGVTPTELDAVAVTKQPIDATLTALAGLNAGTGLVEQTGADAFTKRALGVAAGTSVPTRADADARYALKATETDLDAAEATLAALQGEVTTARSGSASLDARIDSVAATASSNDAAFTALQSEVVTARSGSATLDARIDGISTVANAAATKVSFNALQSEITTAREGSASLDVKLDLMETDFDTLEADINARADATEAAVDVVQSLISWDRPADNLTFFTDSIAGGSVQALDPIEASQLVWTDEGQAVKLTDPPDGVDYVRIAVRHKFYLESARRYRVRWMVKRAVNAPDPLNDAIVPKLAWFESTLDAATPATTSLTPLAYTTGDGWNTVTTVIARAAATGVDHVAPADARFCTPFLDAFGETQQTNLVLIDFEPLETEFYSPDLTALENQINALESIDAGNRLDVLETYHAAPDTQEFEIRNDVVAATIGATVNQIRVHGWDAIDDGMGALLTREASEPNPIVAAWAASTAYLYGDEVSNDGGKIYSCTNDGISAASPETGPSGTGDSSITDGTVTWRFVGLTDWRKVQSSDGAWWQVIAQDVRRNVFKRPTAAAVLRQVDKRLSEVLYLQDFIPEAEHAGIYDGDSDYDCSTALEAALAEISVVLANETFTGGPELIFPYGKIRLSRTVQIKKGCILRGRGSTTGNAGSSTILEFDSYDPLNPGTTGTGILLASRTLDGTANLPGGSGTSLICDMEVRSRYRQDFPEGVPAIGHGIWARSRCILERLNVVFFPEDGVRIAADSNVALTNTLYGNVNNSLMTQVRTSNNGKSGFYINGGDANACLFSHCDATGNFGHGVWDSSFLGNTWVGQHCRDNAAASVCTHYGVLYVLADPLTEGNANTVEPGVTLGWEDVWEILGAGDTNYPLIRPWDSQEEFFFARNIYADSDSVTGGVFVSPYTEGTGQRLIVSPWVVLDSTGPGAHPQTEAAYYTANNISPITIAHAPIDGPTQLSTSFDHLSSNLVSFTAGTGDSLALSWDQALKTFDLKFGNLIAPSLRIATDESETVTGGRAIPISAGRMLFPFGFWMGNAGSVSDVRYMGNTAAAPSSGEWAQGDIIWNREPTPYEPAGWICTTGGAATTASWNDFTTYDLDALRDNDSGKTYRVVAGTSAASGGPTGTAAHILDGSVAWAYQTPIAWKPGDSITEVEQGKVYYNGGPKLTGIINDAIYWIYKPGGGGVTSWAVDTFYDYGGTPRLVLSDGGKTYGNIRPGTSVVAPSGFGDITDGTAVWRAVLDWVGSTSYIVGEYCWNDEAIWICTNAGTSSNVTGPTLPGPNFSEPAPSTVQWALVASPAWLPNTAYVVGDAVINCERPFICETAGTSEKARSYIPRAVNTTSGWQGRGPLGTGEITDGTVKWINEWRRTTTIARANSTAYSVGDLVLSNGYIFVAIQAGTSGLTADAPSGAGIPDAGVVWNYIRDWLSNTVYEPGDFCVNDDGKHYKCVAGISGSAPGPTGTGTGILDGSVVWDYQTAPVFAPFGRLGLETQQTIIDAPVTLNPTTGSPYHTLYSGTLTATRTVTLSAAANNAGRAFKITRSADGAFNLTIGASLTFLQQEEWCVVVSDGSAWYLESRGRLKPDMLNETIATDAAFTLTPYTSAQRVLHTGTLTANRAVTLSTTNAYVGHTFRITRTGGGAFNLNVGTGPLKALATNTWGEFTYDGTAYYLSAYGAL